MAGARAVIGVLRNGRDVAPDRRKDAADLAAKLDAGTATAADVESFAARHAHDDACRIANASAHKQNRADERDRRRAKRSNGSEPAAAAAPPSSPPPGPAEHEAEIATTWRRLESLGAKRDGVTEDDVRRLVLGLRRLDAAAETRTDQVRSLVLAPHDRRDAGWYRDARKLLAAAEVLPAAAPTQVAPPRIDPVTRAAIDATALKLKGLATRRRVEDALCGLEQIRTGPSAARAAELRAVELRSRDTHWFGLVEAFVRAQDAGQDRPDRAALRRIQAIAEGKGPPSVIESARAYLRTQNGEGAADPVDMLDSLERRLASQHETVGAGEAA